MVTPEGFEKPFTTLPENKAPPSKKHKKLLTTLEDKMKYTIHYVNLQQALSLGLQLKKGPTYYSTCESYLNFQKAGLREFLHLKVKRQNNAELSLTVLKATSRLQIGKIISLPETKEALSSESLFNMINLCSPREDLGSI
ncbi:hypothetical protein J437_LFUL009533 [Ladona fulva]|uniref:Uncharacterized protein n=1 Tax=Ladona fulva TaxID=123851 RepID=A0A8K0K842_LADFU|nr:hypothetical protein J437_LFUL009533 [Ladona fulva]